jgi:hypothetical protein
MTPDTALAALVSLVEPPPHPTRPDTIDWDEFSRRNGFDAPLDYRVLMTRYGTGGFGTAALPGGWLYTLDPFDPVATLTQQSDWDRRNARGLQRQFPEQYPRWPMWPEDGGLLPWANTADGDLVGWWTVGTPDRWGTRFFGRSDEFEEFEFGAVEFIGRLLSGTLGVAGLDSRFSGLAADEDLSFFPMPPDAMRNKGVSRVEVTVTFAGLSSVIDPATLPSTEDIVGARDPEESMRLMSEFQRRWREALRPADELIAAWRSEAKAAGFSVTGVGSHRSSYGDVYHHELRGSFDPADEAVAKRLVADLSVRLGVAISEVRNLEYGRIWEDLTITR